MEEINQIQANEHDAIKEFCRITGEENGENAIRKACEVALLNIKNLSFPIALDKLLLSHNAIVEEKNIPTDGRLEIEDANYKILIREKTSFERKRFTIAHELAHIIIIETLVNSPNHLRSLTHPTTWNKVEKLCDYAAAEILVPDNDFVDSVKQFKLTTEGIEKIKCRYQVSYEVIFKKFIKNFSPSAIILWKSKGTGLELIAPKIIRHPYSSISGIHIKKDSSGTPHLRTLVKAAIKTGSAWSNSVECAVAGKKQSIMIYVIPTINEIPFIDFSYKYRNNQKIEEQEMSYYDAIMFYLPNELILNSDVLQQALTTR